jgi:hypothetical protein
MTKNNNESFRKVQALIRKEEEHASRTFEENEDRFTARLYEKIAELENQPQPAKKPRLYWLRPFVLVPAAAALIVVVALALFMRQPHTGPSQSDVQQLEQVFLQAARAYEGEPSTPDDIIESTPQYETEEMNQLYSEVEWLIKGGFYKANAPRYDKENLKKIFENLFCLNCKQKQEPPLIPLNPDKINLEQRIKNFKKKKITGHESETGYVNKNQFIS